MKTLHLEDSELQMVVEALLYTSDPDFLFRESSKLGTKDSGKKLFDLAKKIKKNFYPEVKIENIELFFVDGCEESFDSLITLEEVKEVFPEIFIETPKINK